MYANDDLKHHRDASQADLKAQVQIEEGTPTAMAGEAFNFILEHYGPAETGHQQHDFCLLLLGGFVGIHNESGEPAVIAESYFRGNNVYGSDVLASMMEESEDVCDLVLQAAQLYVTRLRRRLAEEL